MAKTQKYTVRYWWTNGNQVHADRTYCKLTLRQAQKIAEDMERDGMQTMIEPYE